MKTDWNSYVTASGILGALFFVAVGVLFLFTQHSRRSILELLLSTIILFILMPIACLWARRKKVETGS